jgi:molecular chaperone DnaK
MGYFLGVDLGTTYTAAATLRDGRTTMVELGDRAATIPTVVFLREDETILTGDAANRRGAGEPGRVAREFKRRVGDTTPILLGGAPYSAEALMGKLLRWVVDTVSERQGGPPDGIAVAHPANWGPYKQDLLQQAVARADLHGVTAAVSTITEPEAAVTYYASQERVDTGQIVAVYDLGGGTFDAAVVRKTADGIELLGSPEGIERLGGVDVDEAVFSHVLRSLGDLGDRLDPDDPATTAALVRLRDECVEAKEALSADTEVAIPVLLPGVSSEVRMTRAELEAMIRPPLADSITAMRRALRSADVAVEDLHAVLLAGGSSRIPLVAQMVGAELGRPVAIDTHPKHGVALGAAQAAGREAGAGTEEPAGSPAGGRSDAASGGGAAAGAGAAGIGSGAAAVGAAVGAAAGAAAAGGADRPTVPADPADVPTAPVGAAASPSGPPTGAAGRTAEPIPSLSTGEAAALAAPTVAEDALGGDPDRLDRTQVMPPPPGGTGGPPPDRPFAPRPARERPEKQPQPNRKALVLAGLIGALVLAGAAIALTGGGDDDPPAGTDGTTTTVGQTSATESPGTTAPPATDPPATEDDGGGGGGEPDETTTSSSTTSSSTTSSSTTSSSTTSSTTTTTEAAP